MTDDSLFLLDETEEQMELAYGHLEKEFTRIRAGKASPQLLEDIKVDFYGVMTPLNQAANINTPDARTIVVQPWDKSVLSAIEKAILAANLGFTPMNNGEIIRISIPPITEERRKELVKKAKIEAENARIAIRNLRRNANDKAKKLEKEGVPEDEIKQLEKEIQDITDKWIVKIDKLVETKEKDILTI
jgi:ribosome recycling factor